MTTTNTEQFRAGFEANKLEPCPFCGGPADLMRDEDDCPFICCDACDIRTTVYLVGYEVNAVAAWNRRAKRDASTEPGLRAWIERRYLGDELILETVKLQPMPEAQRAELAKHYRLEIIEMAPTASTEPSGWLEEEWCAKCGDTGPHECEQAAGALTDDAKDAGKVVRRVDDFGVEWEVTLEQAAVIDAAIEAHTKAGSGKGEG